MTNFYSVWTLCVLVMALLIPVTHWILFSLTPRFLRPYRITSESHAAKVGRTEILYNLSTFVIIFAYGAHIFELYRRGWTQIRHESQSPFWLYFSLEFLFLNLLQDAHFYWSHRSLHKFHFLKRAHAIHHRATQPTPWTTFTFHPIEAALNFSFFPLLAVLVPLHWQSLVGYFVFLIVLNINGHLGFEIFPRNLFRLPILKTFNNATHHQIHHGKSMCNYGLYYEFWDRWMNTEFKTYRDIFVKNASGQSEAALTQELPR